MNIWPHQSDVDEFYGNPRGANGEASPKWEQENLTIISPPWNLVTAWDFRPVRSIRVHKKFARSLENFFTSIWDCAGRNADRIHDWGMHLFAGAYNFRLMRRGTRLSMHGWGCAVDFDSARNASGDRTPNSALLHQVFEAFASESWTWGGKWRTVDGMHWQAAKV